MAAQAGSKLVLYAAIAGNLLIAVTKFGAALWTGSSSMISEGVHSLVDTGNQLLLLYGLRRSADPPDAAHPLGHGRELYFWSFIVALLVFALGAGVSFYEGIVHILKPEPARNIFVNYVVLGLSILFEGISWVIALRHFQRYKGDMGYWEAVRRSKDPTNFVVLLEDSAALLGLLIALAAIFAAEFFDMPVLDGVGSLGIGIVLAFVAVLLAIESKGLLIGERAPPSIRRRIVQIAAADSDVVRVTGLLTVQLGPESVIAGISVKFRDELGTRDIERSVARIEGRIRSDIKDVTQVFVRPQPAQAETMELAQQVARRA